MALNAFATAGLWETSQPVVASFWQQVQALPTSASFLLSPEKTLALYSRVDPLTSALTIMLIVAFACWFMSVLSGNYSWVDRIWSIVPFAYCWHFAIQSVLQPAENPFGDVLPLFPPVQSSEVTKGIFDIAAGAAITRVLVFGWEVDARLALMTLLTTLWGIRLTYNFFRKGGYEWSSEDYRWPVLRKLMPPGLFQIFNIVFIALYQNFLLFLLAAPAYVAWLVRDVSPLNWIDGVAAGGFLLCLLGETIADQQQWNFQTKKYDLIRQQEQNRGSSSSAPVDAPQPSVVENGHGDYRRGFITHGLFRFSRHPNFFCEITLWWTVYLFAVAATQGQLWVQWTALGAFLLTLLFQGSTTFTEKLSLRKYPAYALYQQSTSRLLPWFPASSTPGEPAAVDPARKKQ